MAAVAAGCVTPTPWTGAGKIPCPVKGTAHFTDDFGSARSGHTHQGIDIFVPKGTENVAVVSGTVEQRVDPTGGGNTIWLTAKDGTRYVYMHLDRFKGAPGTVAAKAVIGYTGSTGNVFGDPHTHFEIRPNGGTAVNPYSTLLEACPSRS